MVRPSEGLFRSGSHSDPVFLAFPCGPKVSGNICNRGVRLDSQTQCRLFGLTAQSSAGGGPDGPGGGAKLQHRSGLRRLCCLSGHYCSLLGPRHQATRWRSHSTMTCNSCHLSSISHPQSGGKGDGNQKVLHNISRNRLDLAVSCPGVAGYMFGFSGPAFKAGFGFSSYSSSHIGLFSGLIALVAIVPWVVRDVWGFFGKLLSYRRVPVPSLHTAVENES